MTLKGEYPFNPENSRPDLGGRLPFRCPLLVKLCWSFVAQAANPAR
jgi:hypothetical protein